MCSPEGECFPRSLPWDFSNRDLEEALEWTYDVADVTVEASYDAERNRAYRITFEVRSSGEAPSTHQEMVLLRGLLVFVKAQARHFLVFSD